MRRRKKVTLSYVSHGNISRLRQPAEFLVTTKLFEPITLTVIGTAIGEGALKWLGGKLMDQLFPPGKSEVAILLEKLVKQIAELIHREIEQNALREATAQLSAAQANFFFYMNAPTNDRLEHVTRDIINAVKRFESLGLVGHAAYMNAVAFVLLVFQERSRRYPEHQVGELENIVRLVADAAMHHGLMITAWEKWNMERFALVKMLTVYMVTKDGKILLKTNNRSKAENLLKNSAFSSFLEETRPTYIAPLDALMVQWKYVTVAIDWCINMDDTREERLAETTQKLASGVHPSYL
ncbi:hypothetical protein [Hymenobacter perfusus]|uniref:Uncharacterized protein n=1 Tax=Hymenobacter perfusus TaxID=1236770 RepID=A0A3R9MEE8_9BACT|nr:hypothetical protein [Hymenobacter perfusus]RSK38446.1 hypothetical protein EI293_21750 [Hymenobacter perfusus]